MSGMERVVRPVVFPDIRPQAARQLPPEEDPTKGICEIKGQGSFVTQWSINTSWSISYGKEREVKRQVDTARVYQKESSGTVNKENFVDIDVANEIWMEGMTAPGSTTKDNELHETGGRKKERWSEKYKPVQPDDNIEITKKGKIIRNDEPGVED